MDEDEVSVGWVRQAAVDMPIVAPIITTVLLISLGIIWAEYPFLARAIAFETSPIAWLQSSLLVACSILSYVVATADLTKRHVWYLVSGLLLIAALDERFMFHEHAANWMLYHWFHGDSVSMGRIGSLPMLGYPITGLLIVTWIWQTIRPARFWIIAALCIGIVAIGLDIATDNMDAQIVEELLEVVAETLFFCALLIAHRRMST